VSKILKGENLSAEDILKKAPKSILRFIKRKTFQEAIELIIGEDTEQKIAKRIIQKREKAGWNLITPTSKQCPKCKERNLDNLGLFRVIGGVIELYRCEKCRYVEHKTILDLPNEKKTWTSPFSIGVK